jgi:4-alpha-glucanotransferase
MDIRFQIKYPTNFGQHLELIWLDNKHQCIEILKLKYNGENCWMAIQSVNPEIHRRYQYRVVNSSGEVEKVDPVDFRNIFPKNRKKSDRIVIQDCWPSQTPLNKTPEAKAIQLIKGSSIFGIPNVHSGRKKIQFKAYAPMVPAGLRLAMLGSTSVLNNWDESRPIFLVENLGWWHISFPRDVTWLNAEFKCILFDASKAKVMEYESGSNLSLFSFDLTEDEWIVRHYPVFVNFLFKGAGINIQLSSLRSERSWGIGDFGDLKLFNHWAASTGFKLIQLLPINDTTVYQDERDSYPYAAISAFALHPIFLDMQALLHRYNITVSDEWKLASQNLNQTTALDYSSVLSLKRRVVKILMEQTNSNFLNDSTYQIFFRKNRHWLVPYAVFSVCRDRFGTAEYNTWPNPYREVSPTVLNKMANKKSTEFPLVAFYYFLQFELHLQLIDTVTYAHNMGLAIKGDLPIGVGRYSVETWMKPSNFSLDQQAGAPPDAFSKNGQNWKFPTYNWYAMKADAFAWWKQRLSHMEQYMDAIRIDHVLGFFRIWSIPAHANDGRLGRFVPAIPFSSDELVNLGITTNLQRLVSPYWSKESWEKKFGKHADFLAEQLLDNGKFKNRFQNQKAIQQWFYCHPDSKECEQGILDLLTEVILLEDDRIPNHYHFRINMMETESYKALDTREQEILKKAYFDFFYERQNKCWIDAAYEKLNAICGSTRMLICAEDLGMVPELVGPILHDMEILTLQVQRMPTQANEHYAHPAKAPYLSVVMPSTHDMSPLRSWWQELNLNRELFWHDQLGMTGSAPGIMHEKLIEAIILSHLRSPAMWAIFLIQDLLALQVDLVNPDVNSERINDPVNPDHVWNYRMHITIENLQQDVVFKNKLQFLLQQNQR